MASSNEEQAFGRRLLKREVPWRERYAMLESHGYRLRPRYKPDWKPSWSASNKSVTVYLCEDYASRDSSYTMDAVRISDGRRVFLKRIPTGSLELTIHRFLSDPQRLQDLDNHTAALLDDFVDDDDPRYTYIVLPLLRRFYSPKFFSVDEVVDFIKQILEGLVYMHQLNVAHRDCAILNIMMDADSMYPKGFHPVHTVLDATGTRLAHPKRRRDVGGVRYYFIDFGISSKFGPDDESTRVVGTACQDSEVPELSDTRPYSPFRADVFIIGNLIRKEFLKKYENLGFLEPLVEEMTARNWYTRCTSDYALELFNGIIRQQPSYNLRWALKERDSGAINHFFQDVGSISRESAFRVRNAIGEVLVTYFKDAGLIQGDIAAKSNKVMRFIHMGLKHNKSS